MSKIDFTRLQLCEIHPINFNFTAGMVNPADPVTRPLSYKSLIKTSYFTGPVDFHVPSSSTDEYFITVPMDVLIKDL